MRRPILTFAIPVIAVAAAVAGWFGVSAVAQAAETVVITLNGTSATSSSTTGVSISGSTVTITAAGTYQLSGTLSNGQIVVNTADSGVVAVVLSGASIASSTGAAVSVTSADTVTVTLAAGTTNNLSDDST